MRRKYRKEPRNLDAFIKRYKERERDSAIAHIESRKVHQMVEKIAKLVENGDGAGHRFIFPLTESISVGDFMKGVLKVVAPKAEVTFLLTPKSNSISMTNQSFLRGLDARIKKAIKSTDKKVVIVDNHFKYGTARAITKSLRWNEFNGEVSTERMQEFMEILNAVPDSQVEQDFTKPNSGFALLNWKNYLRFSKKHPREVSYLSRKKSAKRIAFSRRKAYNLGIACAKDYLVAK